MEKKLYRDEYRKKIGGVCAGLAEYFDMDVAIIRALFVLTFIFMGTGFMAYIVLWIVIPNKGVGYFNPNVDYRVPPQQPFAPFDANRPASPGAAFEPVFPKKHQHLLASFLAVSLYFLGQCSCFMNWASFVSGMWQGYGR